mgnify:CR=1 FL=1
MPYVPPSDETLRKLFVSAKTIAVVGCSPRPERTSHQIAAAMQARGYRIVPIHPAGGEILGEKVFPNLASIPRETRIDIVNVFRRAEHGPALAATAVDIGARALWLQQGVYSEEAARIAAGGGLVCVMDQCIAVIHRLLSGR